MRKRIVDKREKKREPRERKTAEMTFGFPLSLLFSRFSTIHILLSAACLLLCPKPAQAAVPDTLTITEKGGVTTTNYPVQIGRPFVPGEIGGSSCVQAVLSPGGSVPTQTDIKTRWPDTSIKHAILSFLIPTLNANQSITVNFQPGSCNNTPLTPAQMLDTNQFDFDAQMVFSNGITGNVSARQMLQDGNFTYWTSGPIATTIILADHSANRVYDVGTDSHRSIRPIIHATFWPATHQIRVRFIAENTLLTALQDQSYGVTLALGHANPQMAYTNANVYQAGATRWTKEMWIGAAPEAQVNINHNLVYLEQTKLVPNYNPALTPTDSSIQSDYTAWSAAQKDLYQYGLWDNGMQDGGGRPEQGYWPQWSVRWLYTGDWREKAVAFGSADLAGAWPLNIREGGTTIAFFDNNHHPGDPNTVPGTAVGRIASVQGRPTIGGVAWQWGDQSGPLSVGTMTDGPNNWWPDETPPGAHIPGAFDPQYLLSGDFWYLEQMYFWATSTALMNSGEVGAAWGRGPAGCGGLNHGGEPRSDAWPLRCRMHAAVYAPDGTPEKAYFMDLVTDVVAQWEGWHGLANDVNAPASALNYHWGQTTGMQQWKLVGATGPALPALHYWGSGQTTYTPSYPAVPPLPASWPVLPTSSSEFAVWQDYYMIFVLGQARDMGLGTDALLAWMAPRLTAQFQTPGWNPYHFAEDYIPASIGPTFLPSWPATEAVYYPLWNPYADSFATETGVGWAQDSGILRVIPAAAAVADQPGGAAAWNWIQQNMMPQLQYNVNDWPKWQVVPRQPVPPPPDGPPQIITQPQSVWVRGTGSPVYNNTYEGAAFVVIATGHPLNYEWQEFDPVANVWTTIPGSNPSITGASTPGITISVWSIPPCTYQGFPCGSNGMGFRVKVFNNFGSVVSSSATLTITGTPPNYGGGPAIYNPLPDAVLPAGTVQATLSVNTDINATCKYDTVGAIDYSAMPNTFAVTGGTLHQQLVTGLVHGQIPNYFVRCQDQSGNASLDDFIVWMDIDSGSGGGQVALPSLAPAGGNFASSVSVSIQDATANSILYYTLDGTTPTTASSVYSTPLVLTQSKTVSVFAAASGMAPSPVVQATFSKCATDPCPAGTPPPTGGGNPPPVPVNPGTMFSVQVYPNPWRSDKHASHPTITFSGLLSGTTIKLFTISGHKVKELLTDESSISWDLTNTSGDKVASGIYLYVITDAQGNKVRGKVAVIK